MGIQHNVVNCDLNYYMKDAHDEEQLSDNCGMGVVSYEQNVF